MVQICCYCVNPSGCNCITTYLWLVTVTGYSSFADSVFKDISCKFEKENKPVYAEKE